MTTLQAIAATKFGDAAADAASDEDIPVSMQKLGSN